VSPRVIPNGIIGIAATPPARPDVVVTALDDRGWTEGLSIEERERRFGPYAG
jgi:hypothetical protein